MDDTASLVVIDPSDQQLVFTKEEHPTPGTTGLTASITIHNKHPAKSVLFRVQTTSPLSYRVRPSHGRIEPASSASVSVVLAVDSKKGDKFLVKYVVVPVTLEGDFNDIFQVGGKPEEYRLRCLLPIGVADGVGQRAPSSDQEITTVPTVNTSNSLLSSSVKSDQSIEAAPSIDAVSPIMPIVQVKSDNNESISELKQKLSEALEKNKVLQKKIEELTHRAVSEHGISDEDALLNRALLHASEHNVPPVLVALIALFAFLLGLLF